MTVLNFAQASAIYGSRAVNGVIIIQTRTRAQGITTMRESRRVRYGGVFLANETVPVNETVRLNIVLQNTQNEPQPMSVAVIGIPGGLSLQTWQLRELQEQEVFDFYEIIDDNLVIYYRELGANETRIINLDLRAEIPGTFTGIASSAYVYYKDEHKYWINGLTITIE